ncbi:putative B3 domain-containing protein Os04g0347400 [Chenopodium quinoa]|uniref:putative B3 domain-containing protein Os04g0347400 n=1 Tax=Chenopodium quinoa TaxID=63459 RepID=UPI000B777B31|nr:putative B3 domain-containing protein Os04g0347400 [Chenopodium quinoa]
MELFLCYFAMPDTLRRVIPGDFVKNFNGKIIKFGCLRNLQGKIWKVELAQAGCKLIIKKGWKNFVVDNSLTRGDFLTFGYNGNVTFTVEIFCTNGCKKEEATATRVDARVYSREVTMIPRSRTIPLNNIQFRRVFKGCLYDLYFSFSSYKIYHFIPANIFDTYNIVAPKLNHSGTILLRNQRGYSQEVKFWKRVDRVALSHGWREFQINSDIDEGDECEFEVIVGEGRKIKEILLLQVHPTSSS